MILLRVANVNGKIVWGKTPVEEQKGSKQEDRKGQIFILDKASFEQLRTSTNIGNAIIFASPYFAWGQN